MGLNDRNYMRGNQQNHEPVSGRSMLLYLIIINLVCFLFIGGSQERALALTVYPGEFRWNYIYQIFSAGFLHVDFWHLFFNMWGLYLFGALVAPKIDGKKMLLLYMTGAAVGNILFIIFNLNSPHVAAVIGASGAVCAMMAAAATVEPERRFVIIFMPFTPIKITTMVICYTAMEVLMELSKFNDNIAHLAHLGGFIGGYLIMKMFFGNNLPWDPFRKKNNGSAGYSAYKPHPQNNEPPPEKKFSSGSRVSQKELDYLLDKLSTHGVNSLSEHELDRLRQARQQMRGEK